MTLNQLTICYFFLLSTSVYALYDCGEPQCSTCLPLEVHDAPGVGFDLSISYGTAVIHHYNGSVRDSAHISARPEYVDLLSDLVTTSEPPPLTTYQKYLRWLNKKLGHPPTVQVGILSSMITDLCAEIKSSYPSITLNNVVVTAPLVPALTQLDLNDAIEHAGLQSWLTEWPSPPKLSESRAQFAGEGNGLCQTYQNQADCDEEEVDMMWETAYFVQFTRYALYTTISTYAAPFSGDWRAEKFEVDFQSGLDNLENFDSPSTFWAHIRTQLLALPSRYPKPITKLLLAGESATDDMFLKVLRDALSEIRGPSHNLLLDQSADGDVNPTFAAARGAALYARIRQEKPFDCSEPKRCEAERQRQRSNKNTVRTELK